jgi:hypothetical protein
MAEIIQLRLHNEDTQVFNSYEKFEEYICKTFLCQSMDIGLKFFCNPRNPRPFFLSIKGLKKGLGIYRWIKCSCCGK